jgi:uncharacterized protein YyaL (SSP411 family)
MDTSEPSTNGTSASNLFRLGSLLADDTYTQRAKETIAAFEAEILQYPWGFGSFLPGVVAGRLGVRGVVVLKGPSSTEKSKEKEDVAVGTRPRGGLTTTMKMSERGSAWLRERNPLLRGIAFPRDGKIKMLVCENGVCREDGVVESESETAILTTVGTAETGAEMREAEVDVKEEITSPEAKAPPPKSVPPKKENMPPSQAKD